MQETDVARLDAHFEQQGVVLGDDFDDVLARLDDAAHGVVEQRFDRAADGCADFGQLHAVGQRQLALAQGGQLGVGFREFAAGLIANVQLGFLDLALRFLDGGLEAVDLRLGSLLFSAIAGDVALQAQQVHFGNGAALE
ncbi:hypothetical protein D3C86_1106850 [compost metagenome]